MTNNPTTAETKVVVQSGSDGPGANCDGIQFDEDELSPEEQQMQITKRMIWEKLMSRLEIGSFDLRKMERAKGFEPSTFTLAR